MPTVRSWIQRCAIILQLCAILIPLCVLSYGTGYANDSVVNNQNHIGTTLWQAVRQNNLPSRSQVDAGGAGPIATDGMLWLDFRTNTIMPVFGYAVAITLAAIFVFWLLRRSISIPGGESGNRILRITAIERFIHWLLVATFTLLAISGFILLYGRPFIIPVLGIEAYSTIASLSKFIHNAVGLLFPLSALLLFLKFVNRNIYERGDLKWLLQGGGILSSAHPESGFFNMGEKILFWLVFLFSVVVSVTGLIMVFQLFEFSRTDMMLTNTLHIVVACAYVLLVFGHIYLATVGVKGTMSAMTDGKVDENWAKAHHSRWYQQVVAKRDA